MLTFDDFLKDVKLGEPQSLADLMSILPRRKRRSAALTYNEDTGTVLVDGDAVLRDMREIAAELRVQPVSLPTVFKISAVEHLPPHRQVLKRDGQVVLICDINEVPEGIMFDEVLVHPDQYEVLKARMEAA